MDKNMIRQNYGHNFGMKCFYIILKYSGILTAYLLLAFVFPFYALRPKIQKSASYYLKKRFSNDNFISRWVRTIRYIYQFGLVLVDQVAVGILGSSIISVDFPKSDNLYSLSKENTGIILLSSHIGTWKMVMAHMGYLAKPLNFLMKIDKKEQNRYFFDISGDKSKYRLIDPTGFMGGMIESANVLEDKECLAVNGDRAFHWHTGRALFFNEYAVFPVIAQNLAYSTGSQLVMLLTSRTGTLSYFIEYINLTEMLIITEKMSKKEIIQQYLDLYAENIEIFLQKNPYMWFNFFDFWYKD
jgi:predicted LPLAT superfamily acyltransferase